MLWYLLVQPIPNFRILLGSINRENLVVLARWIFLFWQIQIIVLVERMVCLKRMKESPIGQFFSFMFQSSLLVPVFHIIRKLFSRWNFSFKRSMTFSYAINGDSTCFSGLFIIAPDGILRQITINDLPVGRSVCETLRLVQAFKYVDTHGEVSFYCTGNFKITRIWVYFYIILN